MRLVTHFILSKFILEYDWYIEMYLLAELIHDGSALNYICWSDNLDSFRLFLFFYLSFLRFIFCF